MCYILLLAMAYNALLAELLYSFAINEKLCHTFLKNCKGYKVETWYTHGQWANVLCIPESGPRAHNS